MTTMSMNDRDAPAVFQEYKHKLARVSQVRKELRSRLSSLPDLSLLPSVTGGRLNLPSSGDHYTSD